MKLVLASSSPRRLELLGRLGATPDRIISPDIDETPCKGELPRDYVMRMAQEKAAAVERSGDEILLAGDTTVAVGRRILGQAAHAAEQRKFLELVSGRRHHVMSAVCVIAADGTARTKLSDSIVKFKRFEASEIEAYIASGEGQGKAGGYAIQGTAEAFVTWMSGSYSGIMGLPLYETRNLLISAGYPLG
ncbi:Maf family protein [Sphingorhabdus sp. 109]|jgi:septum formation protein|uniref:Maf family protein n=1 Tax=Sphingorhabdus sp. 109 TaxID=2653173 RepID=UPI0012F284C2|nr:nucleoside triphosphate pyrophosphatase [Sphingorhabdus sp. 109]VWX58840.1 dTTP/UTP pyrophosphatase [Sphingorhabdus sp. 109]